MRIIKLRINFRQTEPKYSAMPLNWGLFAIGMLGLWLYAHDWIVLLLAWVASIHITYSIKQEDQ